MIELNTISKSYHRGSHVIPLFKNLNAHFEGQSSHAILGKSGSGKTTLLSLLSGLDQPDSGNILINHQNMSALSESERTDFRRQHIGIVFQQFYLMSRLTAFENVLLPLEFKGKPSSDDHDRARELLTRVGLWDRKDHFPSQLSGGECQRVGIARALISKPSFILADEPTGNLDEESSANITQDLFRLVHEERITLILVTHDKDLASHCHRVWNLEHGHLQ